MQKRKLYSVALPGISTVGLVFMLSTNNMLVIAGSVLIVGSSVIVASLLPGSSRSKHDLAALASMPHVDRVTELEGLYHTLQSNYFRKTTELQDKIDDLERFHRLAIGRELRLIELKSEVEKLRTPPDAGSAT
jgi:hypothetical protein